MEERMRSVCLHNGIRNRVNGSVNISGKSNFGTYMDDGQFAWVVNLGCPLHIYYSKF